MHPSAQSTNIEKINMPCIPNCLKKSKKKKQISKKKTDTTTDATTDATTCTTTYTTTYTTTDTTTDTSYNVSKLIARRHSLGARPLSEIPLAGELLKLATEVWNKRDTIEDPYDIYKIYAQRNAVTNHQISASDTALTLYFRNILLLGIETGWLTSAQSLNIPFYYLVSARENYLYHRLPIYDPRMRLKISNLALGSFMTVEDYLLMVMETDFLCFHSQNHIQNHLIVRSRVYLNININNNIDLSSATHIMSFVVREILHKINGVVFTKISLEERIDSIIIYTTNLQVTDKVIAKLHEYQNTNGISGFNCAIPIMTKSKLYGVAIASEPPHVTMKKGQLLPTNKVEPPSFGMFRADLLYNAFKDSTESYDFYELIVKYFRNAGIDANEPAIQLRHRSCLMEAQMNLADQVISSATRR